MRKYWLMAAGCAAAGISASARAGEVPLVAPAPDWVLPTPAMDPAAFAKANDDLPVFDEQILVDGDRTVTYLDMEQYVSNAEQLQRAASISVGWQPAHGDLTFHRIEIVRDGKVIPLLGEPSSFTVLRREARMEQLVLDGTLTATRQLEGVRIGDLVRLSYSISGTDPTLAGKAQSALILFPQPVKIGFGRGRIAWPEGQALHVKSLAGDLPIADTPSALEAGGRKLREIVVQMPIAKLPDLPKGIPARFQPIPLLFATNFDSWSQVASVMAPLYDTTNAIPEGSDLAKTTDAIAAASSDPVVRMTSALRTVQDDVRYLLVALGTGNYAPQAPTDTWTKRYGDCKAKTLLLVAMLRRLGIEAEPVLASTTQGDRVPDYLPAPMAFDHVMTRATIGENTYWLDGTSLGTRGADIGDVPRFGFVLPLRAAGADLVRLPVRAKARPSPAVALDLDDSAGVHMPAPFRLTVTYAGLDAVTQQLKYQSASAEDLRTLANYLGKTWVQSETVTAPRLSYDADAATMTMTVEGVAYPDWSYEVGHYAFEAHPTLVTTFDPDRSSTAWRQIPALIDNPWTASFSSTMRLPAEADKATSEGLAATSLDLPAVTYSLAFARDAGNLVETVRTAETGLEIARGEISQVRRQIDNANARTARVVMPADYPQRWEDIKRMRAAPAIARARQIFQQRIAEDPKDSWRVSDYAWLERRLFDWQAAEKLYTRAIAVDGVADHYSSRAEVREETGDVAGQLADAHEAYDLESSDDDYRNVYAVLLGRSGKVDEALDLLPDQLDVSNDKGKASVETRATIMLEAGRGEDAVDLLDTAIRRASADATLLNDRCWAKAVANIDLEGALADCTRAIELSSEPAAFLDSRAYVRFRSGQLDEADADARAALALSPELASTHYLRSLIAGRQGRKADEARELAAARTISPSIVARMARFKLT